jgi:hypothetical protein
MEDENGMKKAFSKVKSREINKTSSGGMVEGRGRRKKWREN